MRHRTINIVGVALLLAGCATVSRSSAGRVIVPAQEFAHTLGLAEWTPADGQIARCEAALSRALAERGHDLGGYYVRLGGVVRDGAHLIVGFAADTRVAGPGFLEPPTEDTIKLPPFGGGEAFFSFEYDADREKLVRLEFNAAL